MLHLFVTRKSASISNVLYVHIILTNAMFKSYVNHLRLKWKGKTAMHHTLKKQAKNHEWNFPSDTKFISNNIGI